MKRTMQFATLAFVLSLVALVPATGWAQATTIWEVPDGVTMCPAKDGGVHTVRINLEWEHYTIPTLTFNFGDWDWKLCEESGFNLFHFDVTGVYEGDGWYRFDFEPGGGISPMGGYATMVALASGVDYHYSGSLRFRSYDMDQSKSVNTTDISLFAQAFFGNPNASPGQGDFDWDGATNLTDLQALAVHNGHVCSYDKTAGMSSSVDLNVTEMALDPNHAAWGNDAPADDKSWGALKSKYQD